jgi:acyl-CoA thioester hydrolase
VPPFVHRLRVRYHECDRQGIVFNANWFSYFDVALTELWRTAFGSYDALAAEDAEMVVVEASARFRAPARFDDEVEIRYGIERLGRTSMVSAITAARDCEVLVEGRLVHVFVDPRTLAKREIRAAWRERLAPWTEVGGG